MFRILFTSLPVLFCGVIGFYFLHTRWKILYGDYDLNDLTLNDWITVGLFFLSLTMIGVLFNLMALSLGGI